MQGRLISKLYFLWSKILHSIPILLNKLLALGKSRITPRSNKSKSSKQLMTKTYLRYVSYSIPLTCTLALLLLSFLMMNPGSATQTYALEDSSSQPSETQSPETSSSISNLDSPDQPNSLLHTSDNLNPEASPDSSASDPDSGIMPTADVPTASAGLTIEKSSLSGEVAPGGTAYLTNNVTYSAVDTTSYSLQLTYANGNTALSGGTPINEAGTAGVVGSNLPDNTWGFAWGDTTAANEGMTYYTLPAYNTKGTSVATGRLASGTTSATTTKKLVFAAKFNGEAAAGHYKTNALLTLIATPKLVTYNYSITYNANNGTGAPGVQSMGSTGESYTFTLSSTKPTRSGYNFLGWSTSASATTATYQPGAKVTLKSSAPALTLYAIWQRVYNYSLAYNMNGGTGTIATQTANGQTATSYQFTISSTTPTRSGYTFLGWGNAASDTTASYQANGKITLQSSAPTKTLYAVWKALSWSEITTMQQMNPTACSQAPSKTTKTLTDSRDNNSYTIMKLDDGRCWMTQDMRLTGSRAINSTDSDVSGNYTYTIPASVAAWNNTSANLQAVYYSGRGYYTWCVATAGTCSMATAANSTAPSSICPKGWKMPTKTEYTTLLNAAGIADNATGRSKIMSSPYNYSYASLIWGDGSGLTSMNLGRYWTSTSEDAARAFVLGVWPSGTGVYGDAGQKFYGLPFRCVAR